MAFTKALYYPWIDIRDESWLKSGALYWNEIQTIVPESISRPYSTKTARCLEDHGILLPLRVRSDWDLLEQLTQDVIVYLESEEGIALLTRANRRSVYLHPDKLPRSIRHLSRIHPEKISYEIRHLLREYGLAEGETNGFLEVDDEFALFYMTLLATRLAERVGAGLVTSSSLPHNLSLKARTDAKLGSVVGHETMRRREYDGHGGPRRVPRDLAQGMLVELLLENVAIDPKTPIKKIIDYRENHSAELGRLRQQVGALTSSLPEEACLSAMQQHVSDLYINEVKPAVDEFKKSLSGSRIKWLTNGWLKLAFISAGSSSMLVGMGLATASALLVGAGISLVGSAILYNVDKQDAIRRNPYSYLMSLQDEMS